MLSARENYCPDQVTFSGAEPSHPTTIPAAISTQQANTSCASVAYTALLNQLYNFLSTSNKTTTRANPLYCTIHTLRVEEDKREET
jgi:hypothetical protein